jgi:putative membrane protein
LIRPDDEGVMMMYWNNNGMNGWGYALMGVNSLLFWLLLIAGIVLLARYLGDQHPRITHHPSVPTAAEQILAERFARGEIDDEEYRRRLATVRGQEDPRAQ